MEVDDDDAGEEEGVSMMVEKKVFRDFDTQHRWERSMSVEDMRE